MRAYWRRCDDRPPAVIRSLASHPLTDKGLAAFLADIEKTGQKFCNPVLGATVQRTGSYERQK